MEMEKTLGKKNESIAKKIIARFEEELVTQNEEYEPIWTPLGGARTMPIR